MTVTNFKILTNGSVGNANSEPSFERCLNSKIMLFSKGCRKNVENLKKV